MVYIHSLYVLFRSDTTIWILINILLQQTCITFFAKENDQKTILLQKNLLRFYERYYSCDVKRFSKK